MAALSVQKRFNILKRDEFTCQYCGKVGGKLEVDHVIPKCQGGSNDPSNLKTACFECNRGKTGARLDEKTKEFQPQIKYAIHVRKDGTIDWVGKIVERTEKTLFVEVCDVMMLYFGFWMLSGEIRSEPIEEWLLFSGKEVAANTALLENKRIRDQRNNSQAS